MPEIGGELFDGCGCGLGGGGAKSGGHGTFENECKDEIP